jgi:hypothetical protein
MSLIGLKIGWDVARAFVIAAVLTVLPPDLLYRGGNGNNNVGGLFYRFVVFNSYFDKIRLNYQHCILPLHVIDQQFYSLVRAEAWCARR